MHILVNFSFENWIFDGSLFSHHLNVLQFTQPVLYDCILGGFQFRGNKPGCSEFPLVHLCVPV